MLIAGRDKHDDDNNEHDDKDNDDDHYIKIKNS